MGQGFGGFLDLREKVLLLNAMPGDGHTLAGPVFTADVHEFFFVIDA